MRKDDEKNLTIKDIARLCKVSISTVSRAINNDPTINRKTRDRILQIVRQYHYIPNNSARNLRMTDSNTIALLVKGIGNPFFQEMITCIEKCLRKGSYSFLFHSLREEEDTVAAAAQLVKERRLKGIIFLGGRMSYPEEELKQVPVPTVLCSVAVEEEAGLGKAASVTIDDEKETYRAISYLIRRGHRRIALIAGHEADTTVARLRRIGYCRALEEAGIPYDPALVGFADPGAEGYTEACGYETARRLIQSKADFSAIFAISDRMALGVYKAIYDAGKSIPKDYSVMGFDGIESVRYIIPPLTTLKQPTEPMARAAVDLLFRQIKGERVCERQLFTASLLEADSVTDRDGSAADREFEHNS